MKHSIFADHSPLLSDSGVLSHPFNTKIPALCNQVFSSDISLNTVFMSTLFDQSFKWVTQIYLHCDKTHSKKEPNSRNLQVYTTK